MKKRLSLLLALVCIVGALVSSLAIGASAAEPAPYIDTTKFATTETNGEAGHASTDGMTYYTLLAGRNAYIKYAYEKIPSTDYLSFNAYINSSSVLATGFQIAMGSNANTQSSETLLAAGAGIQTDVDYYYDEYSTSTLQIRTYSGSNRYDIIQIVGGQIKKSSKYYEAASEGSDATYALAGYGWHRITTFVRQTTEVVEGAAVYSVLIDVYVNGEQIMSLKPKAEYHSGACYYTATVEDGAVTAATPKDYYIQAYNSSFYGDDGISGTKHGMLRFRAPRTVFAPLALDVKPIKYDYAGGAPAKTAEIPLTEQYIAGKGGTTNGWFFQPYVSATGEFSYPIYANTLQHFVVTGGTAVLPTPVKAGQTFTGWTDDLGNPVDAASLPANGKIVATYSAEGDYTLTVSNKGETLSCKPSGNAFTLGDESAYWLFGGDVYAAGETIALTADATVYALAPTLLDGASVRLDVANPGLRFETTIDKGLYDALESDFAIGTLIIPTDLLGSTAFTVEALDAAEKDYLAIEADLVNDDVLTGLLETADGALFRAAIVNIQAQNYTRKFSAISYIKYDGEYYYSDYSETYNARSIHDVATDAFLGEYASDATVKSYLDKVVYVGTSLTVKNPIAGYTSPYTVSWANNLLTIAKNEGSFTSKDEIASIIIDGRLYTSGWSLSDGKLTAPYALGYRNDFEGATEETVSNSAAVKISLTNNKFKITATSKATVADAAKQTLISVKEADKSLGYMKLYYGQQEKPSEKGQIACTGSLKATVGDTYTKVSYTLSMMKLTKVTPTFNYQLRGTNASGGSVTNNRLAIFKLTNNGTITVAGKVVASLSLNEFNDYTFTIDLVNNTVSVYVNGEYVTTVANAMTISDTYKTSADMTILDWVKTYGGSYFANGTDMQNANDAAAGICFDNILVRAHN